MPRLGSLLKESRGRAVVQRLHLFPERNGIGRFHLGDHDLRIRCLRAADKIAVVSGSHRKAGVIGNRITELGSILGPELPHNDAILLIIGKERHAMVRTDRFHGEELLLGHVEFVKEHIPAVAPALASTQEGPNR